MLKLQDNGFNEDFLLIGIKIVERDLTRFIYLFNKYLSVKFTRTDDLDVSYGGKVFYHALFEYEDDVCFNHYTIIKNLSFPIINENGGLSLFSESERQFYLLSRYKEFDYLLKINGELIDDWRKDLPLHEFKYIKSYRLLEGLTQKEKQFFYL